jgi:hypothetical protein
MALLWLTLPFSPQTPASAYPTKYVEYGARYTWQGVMPVAGGGRTTCLTARGGTAEPFRSHPVLASLAASATPPGGDAFGRGFYLEHRRQLVPLALYQAPDAFSYYRYADVALNTVWLTASFVFTTSTAEDDDDEARAATAATAATAVAAQSTVAATRADGDTSSGRRTSAAGVTPSSTGQTKTSDTCRTHAYKWLLFFCWAASIAIILAYLE